MMCVLMYLYIYACAHLRSISFVFPTSYPLSPSGLCSFFFQQKLDIKIPDTNGFHGRTTDDSIENTSEVDLNDG